MAILQHNLEAIKNLSEIEQRQLYYMPNVNGNKSVLKQFITTGYSLAVVCEYSDKITISQQNRVFHFNKILYTKAHQFKGLTYKLTLYILMKLNDIIKNFSSVFTFYSIFYFLIIFICIKKYLKKVIPSTFRDGIQGAVVHPLLINININ